MPSRSLAALAVGMVAATSSGCRALGVYPDSYHFSARPQSEDPVDTVVRTLVANGYETSRVDRRAGIVQTRWESVSDVRDIAWARRYAVLLARAESGTDVQVRTEVQRCKPQGFRVFRGQVYGDCEKLNA